MGKIKRKKKAVKYKSKRNVVPASKTSKPIVVENVDSLLKQVEENVDVFDYEAAEAFCHRALDLEATNVRALEALGNISLETGNFEQAKSCLSKAVDLAPDSSYSKYMVLAQLHSGREALKYYKKGIDILNKDLRIIERSGVNQAEEKNARLDLSAAHCAVAELYMTDCCFDENAEIVCEENLQKSIACDETNIEAHQTFASYYLIKEEKQKALASIQKSLSLWLPRYQDVREGKTEPGDVVEVCPLSYEARTSAVKILIELEEYDSAGLVLEGLVEENDEVVEIWYLLGWMNYLRGDDFISNARFYFQKCQEVAKKIHSEEEDILNHVEELLAAIGPQADSDEEDKENEPNSFSDVSSAEEEMEQ